MKGVFITPFRFYTIFFAVCITFCSLGGRLVYLQVFKASDFSEIANSSRKNVVVEKARRGDIVDSKGNLLATTRTVVDVGLDPHSFDEEDSRKLLVLANILDIKVSTIHEAVKSKLRKSNESDSGVRKVRWVKLKDSVTENAYRKIKELNVSGVYGNYKHSRHYPGNNLACHLLGFVNKEDVAVMGVEKFTNYYLKGQDGWRISEKDGKRREMPQFRTVDIPSSDGLNVELSVDWFIQDVVEKEIARIVDDFLPVGVSVIVSEPTSGGILAMANAPDFDLNNYNKFDFDSQRNRALTDVYEPGSTFKIVSLGGCLNEGILETNDIIDCSKPIINRGHRIYRLPSDHNQLGKISVKKVVQKSSNRGAAQMGILLGANRMYEYCKLFGFGQKTGLGIGGERVGTLHNPKNWDGLTITRLPMGHAVDTTAIQVHNSMSVIANGGILMKPKIVNRVFDKNGKTVTAFDTKPIRRVLSSRVAKQITDMLVSVVSEEGTARNAKINGYKIAGKTGTTQKIINGQYSRKHHVGSFVGFFPAEDPKIVITVVVDEAKMKNGMLGYGGTVAAPAFKNIATKIINYLGISPFQESSSVASYSNFEGKSVN